MVTEADPARLPLLLNQIGSGEKARYLSEVLGGNGHQRELARLKDHARKRKFDIVLVWVFDRLSREGAAAILNLVSTFKVYGVQVISYQESWTEVPGEIGEILYAIAGWVARMESQRRSERTKAGLARLKAQGKSLGRPQGAKDKKKRKPRRFN